MAASKFNGFQAMLSMMVDNQGGAGSLSELCHWFQHLLDIDKGLITFDSLKKNSALLGLQELRDDDLLSMLKEGDLDGDGALDQMEFCVLMFRLSPELMQESEAWLDQALQQEFRSTRGQ